MQKEFFWHSYKVGNNDYTILILTHKDDIEFTSESSTTDQSQMKLV